MPEQAVAPRRAHPHTGVKVLAIPRDPNPFQERLYERMRALGSTVSYLDGPLDGPLASQTVNLALLPIVLLLDRCRGFRILHVHWVFGFVPAWAHRPPFRRLFRLWFVVTLTVARLAGYRVVWTAHNVRPHTQVFDDDEAARRSLVGRCDAVVAMNTSVADGVRAFSPSCPVTIIPHGADPVDLRAFSGVSERRSPAAATTFLFFGRVEGYKGVPDLLRAYSEAALDGDTLLVVAGTCQDGELEAEIRILAAGCSRAVRLDLRKLSDDDLDAALAEADVLVLPFREIFTSGSVLTGMGSGHPVVVPDLPSFADIPAGALLRYPPGPDGLRSALESVDASSREERSHVVVAAGQYLAENGWDLVAERYTELFTTMTDGWRS